MPSIFMQNTKYSKSFSKKKMGRFSDLFQESSQAEEVFAPASVVESVEVSTPELSAPEAVAEEKELFNPKDKNGSTFHGGNLYENSFTKKKTKNWKRG